MQVLKRELLIGLTVSALVFASALAWGSPFTTFAAAQTTAGSSAQQQTPGYSQQQQTPNYSQQSQMGQQQSSQTFTGTVVKSGSGYALQTTSGQTFKLSGATGASSYVGKTVTVSGTKQGKTIQVSSISPA